MIDVSLELRADYPNLNFLSCTLLCDVRTPSGNEFFTEIRTGRLNPKPRGETGLPKKLRSIHGGLYAQSDLVVADDPFAEIAARTWTDEYAKLDRSQLLTLIYGEWVAQAENDVVVAVSELNGPFLPNTFDGTSDEDTNEEVREVVGRMRAALSRFDSHDSFDSRPTCVNRFMQSIDTSPPEGSDPNGATLMDQ